MNQTSNIAKKQLFTLAYVVLFISNIFIAKIDSVLDFVLFVFLLLLVKLWGWNELKTAIMGGALLGLTFILSFMTTEVTADKFAVLGISLLAISVFKNLKRVYVEKS